jgi:hypothetical protein
MTPFSLVDDYRRFGGGTYSFYPEDRGIVVLQDKHKFAWSNDLDSYVHIFARVEAFQGDAEINKNMAALCDVTHCSSVLKYQPSHTMTVKPDGSNLSWHYR